MVPYSHYRWEKRGIIKNKLDVFPSLPQGGTKARVRSGIINLEFYSVPLVEGTSLILASIELP